MPKSNQNELLESHDGSHTLMSEQFGVTYHSHFGALEESLTVFLSAGYHGIRLKGATSISILEVGFGTGLNALLSLIESEVHQLPTKYTGIEAYPISAAQAKLLNFVDILDRKSFRTSFEEMHSCKAVVDIKQHNYFTFNKQIEKLEDFESDQLFDVIYFDAFAPSAQPELWSPEIMVKLFKLTKPGGTLVTYCAQGQFKRNLKAAGFTIEGLPGPGKKREMTRAWKPE